MAEIKSTLDLVMERAERMGKATAREIQDADAFVRGRQMAAAYLEGTEKSLLQQLAELPPEDQVETRRGMIDTLLRNIFLPRTEKALERTDRATSGILDLASNAGDLQSIIREIQHILGQYRQHREQLRSQLESQVRMQYEQLLAQQPGLQAEGLRIDPTRQPKFQEEWSRIQAELDSQYSQALMQHRQLLEQRLGVSGSSGAP